MYSTIRYRSYFDMRYKAEGKQCIDWENWHYVAVKVDLYVSNITLHKTIISHRIYQNKLTHLIVECLSVRYECNKQLVLTV